MIPSLRNGASALALLTVLFGGAARAETVREGLVLDHVTVVDVRTGRLARDRAVVVAGDRIVRVARGGSVRAAGAARLVDGRGRYVAPGFNDMHAHNLNTESPETSLPLMLASGITGFRQMAGSSSLLAARADGRPLLPKDSPALLALSGELLVGPAFGQPEAVTAAIGRQKAEGADFIKVVDLPPKAFIAAADAAAANGLPLAGHLPLSVDAREAMAHHMGSIEHLGPTISLLLNCSRDETPIRAFLANIPPGVGGVNFAMPPEQLKRALANPNLLVPAPAYGVMRRVIATYDEARCKAFAADVAGSRTWMVPTLTRLEAMNLGNDPALRDNPDLRFAPAATRAMWLEVGQDFERKLTADQRQVLADLFVKQLALARLFDEAGVKMLAGTDFGGQWIAPGKSLHREFDLLGRAGVRPLTVLQMTTINPAIFLKREKTMGTVEAGKAADLVLLDADPTASVANLHRITAVVRGGRLIERAELDAIETRAADALK